MAVSISIQPLLNQHGKTTIPGAVNITTGTIDAYCYDNPQQLYEVQASGSLAQTDHVGNLD